MVETSGRTSVPNSKLSTPPPPGGALIPRSSVRSLLHTSEWTKSYFKQESCAPTLHKDIYCPIYSTTCTYIYPDHGVCKNNCPCLDMTHITCLHGIFTQTSCIPLYTELRERITVPRLGESEEGIRCSSCISSILALSSKYPGLYSELLWKQPYE